MSRVEELSNLTQAISRSFGDRMAGLEALEQSVKAERQASRSHLEAMAAARKEMAERQRGQMEVDRQALRSRAVDMMEGFIHSRAEMAASQREALTTANARRRAEVADAMEANRSARDDTGRSTRAQLRNDRRERKAVVFDLLEGLHQARVEMGASQGEALATDSRQRAEDVQQFLAETRQGREATATLQKEKLAGGRADLQAEVSESISGFRVARSALRADLDEFGQRWSEFASLMRDKRTTSSSVEIEEQVKLGPRLEVDDAAQPERAEAGSPERGEAVPLTTKETAPLPPHLASLPENGSQTVEEVFLAVQASREGIKLVDLENQFNVSRIEMAQVVKRLMDEGRVRKEDRFYFATT